MKNSTSHISTRGPLPIESALPGMRSAFQKHRNVVLTADPGAGKTTHVPLALLEEEWLAGQKIIMLEPRRLAAQRSATYMSQQLGERPGETIGYRIRGETKVSARTRIEVVTEGILTRLLQCDPSLADTGLVIFDEFHERSIHADLGLALTLNVQEHLRNDIRILIMSATLNHLSISSLLGDAPIIKSEGRMFPVTTHYLEKPNDGHIEPLVVSTIIKALKQDQGDILVFLPGQFEIRKAESLLSTRLQEYVSDDRKNNPGVVIHPLFGEAAPEQQQAALAPSGSGARKVILATSIAETSLTIDGVRVVVDSGLSRSARFNPRRGMSGLVTTPVSQSSADQRRGRAGRQQPGSCYRLWTESQHNQLPEFSSAEILVADLAPLALELARWGTPEGEGLHFLDHPPAAHLSQARELLYRLGALDAQGKLTKHGYAMSELPIHPRLAHMLLRGKEFGLGAIACDVAALLEERDILRGGRDNDVDLHSRWYALRKDSKRDSGARERILAQAKRLKEIIHVKDITVDEERLGVLLALAYPDRIGKRVEKQSERYQLSNGTLAKLPSKSMLSRHEYLAVADVDGLHTEARIFLAEPIIELDIRKTFGENITNVDDVRWDDKNEIIAARRTERLGALQLSETPLSLSNEVVKSKMIEGIRLMGLQVLPWEKQSMSIKSRSEWLRVHEIVGEDWPDLSEQHLLATLEEWLDPYLDGITKRLHLNRLDMSKIIESMFSYKQLRELDRLAPTHIMVPTGSHIPLDYSSNEQPVLAVRLQEMFGETETPTIGGGKVKVLLHLLSPAHRPLAVTQDLPSFWKQGYPQVRKDMRGRYPKHYWPENPLEAEPTRRRKHRRAE